MSRWLFLLSLLGIAALCLGAEKPQRRQPIPLESRVPVGDCSGPGQAFDVTAEQTTVDIRTHTILFEKNVRVRRCEMIILCQRLRIIPEAGGATAERIVATGNVRFQQGTRRLRADRAEYVDAEQKIVLTGNPRAWDTTDQNEMTGEEMVFLVQDEKLLVKRARVLFHPRQQVSKAPNGR